jgi:hypothetical protein
VVGGEADEWMGKKMAEMLLLLLLVMATTTTCVESGEQRR